MFDCTKIEEYISLYADRQIKIGSPEWLAIIEHCEECEECRAFFEDVDELCDGLSLLHTPMPENLHEMIMQAVETESKGHVVQYAPKARAKYISWAALAAVFCLVIFSGSFSGLYQNILGVSAQKVSETKGGGAPVINNAVAPLPEAVQPEVFTANGLQPDGGERNVKGVPPVDASFGMPQAALTLPEGLVGEKYGFLLVATCNDTAVIESITAMGTFAIEDEKGHTTYIEIENTITAMESVVTALEKIQCIPQVIHGNEAQIDTTSKKSLIIFSQNAQ